MRQVNVHVAKTHLSELLSIVERGEDVAIARAGVPVAKLIAYVPTKTKRAFGLDEGKFEVPSDFDEPLSEIQNLFYGPDESE